MTQNAKTERTCGAKVLPNHSKDECKSDRPAEYGEEAVCDRIVGEIERIEFGDSRLDFDVLDAC